MFPRIDLLPDQWKNQTRPVSVILIASVEFRLASIRLGRKDICSIEGDEGAWARLA
jgi:hypothetical protein